MGIAVTLRTSRSRFTNHDDDDDYDDDDMDGWMLF